MIHNSPIYYECQTQSAKVTFSDWVSEFINYKELWIGNDRKNDTNVFNPILSPFMRKGGKLQQAAG